MRDPHGAMRPLAVRVGITKDPGGGARVFVQGLSGVARQAGRVTGPARLARPRKAADWKEIAGSVGIRKYDANAPRS